MACEQCGKHGCVFEYWVENINYKLGQKQHIGMTSTVQLCSVLCLNKYIVYLNGPSLKDMKPLYEECIGSAYSKEQSIKFRFITFLFLYISRALLKYQFDKAREMMQRMKQKVMDYLDDIKEIEFEDEIINKENSIVYFYMLNDLVKIEMICNSLK